MAYVDEKLTQDGMVEWADQTRNPGIEVRDDQMPSEIDHVQAGSARCRRYDQCAAVLFGVMRPIGI